jgi:hypothetical protein
MYKHTKIEFLEKNSEMCKVINTLAGLMTNVKEI